MDSEFSLSFLCHSYFSLLFSLSLKRKPLREGGGAILGFTPHPTESLYPIVELSPQARMVLASLSPCWSTSAPFVCSRTGRDVSCSSDFALFAYPVCVGLVRIPSSQISREESGLAFWFRPSNFWYHIRITCFRPYRLFNSLQTRWPSCWGQGRQCGRSNNILWWRTCI